MNGCRERAFIIYQPPCIRRIEDECLRRLGNAWMTKKGKNVSSFRQALWKPEWIWILLQYIGNLPEWIPSFRQPVGATEMVKEGKKTALFGFSGGTREKMYPVSGSRLTQRKICWPKAGILPHWRILQNIFGDYIASRAKAWI